MKEFATENYRSHILIDFLIAPTGVRNLFEENLYDLDSFFSRLSLLYRTRLYERESLIIFDEVQLFPRAREAIKYLVADGRYDYVETGSPLSIKQNTANIHIPSEELHLKMHPMDFEEFLWAKGDDVTFDYLRASYESRKPLGQAVHRKVMSLSREYIVVGGMPQSEKAYVESNDFLQAEYEKKLILSMYRDDIGKYAGSHKEKIRAIYDEIPSSLERHEVSFKLSSLDRDARFGGYEESFSVSRMQ